MLAPGAHVPHTLMGTVHGSGSTWGGVDVPDDLLDLASLWAGGPQGMAQARLDLAAVIRLRELLGEVAAAMLAGGGWPDRPGSNGQPPA